MMRQLADTQMHAPGRRRVPDTHAIMAMTNAGACTTSCNPTRPTHGQRARRRWRRRARHGYVHQATDGEHEQAGHRHPCHSTENNRQRMLTTSGMRSLPTLHCENETGQERAVSVTWSVPRSSAWNQLESEAFPERSGRSFRRRKMTHRIGPQPARRTLAGAAGSCRLADLAEVCNGQRRGTDDSGAST